MQAMVRLRHSFSYFMFCVSDKIIAVKLLLRSWITMRDNVVFLDNMSVCLYDMYVNVLIYSMMTVQ